jgi:hypothetical protein
VAIVGLSLLGAAPLTDLKVPTLRKLPDVAEARSLLPEVTSVASIPTRQPGYQLVTNAGDVLPFGSAPVGSAPAPLAKGVAGVAWTADGGGHWLATRDGGVFTFGDAAFHGSAGRSQLRSPIAGIASTRTGKGYWLVATDGGVFSFGDAKFYGSAAGAQLRAPIVGIAPTIDGAGYWLASADGGVFTFGDAAFHGSASASKLRAPVIGIAATRTGRGYWLAAAEGGVFTFGDAAYRGGAAGTQLLSPIVGIATTRSGKGYWLAAADGGVFSFGDAPFLGSSGGGVWGSVVGIAGGAAEPKAATAKVGNRQLTTRFGHDISWPQCGDPYPKHGYGYAVIGVTRGHPFSVNECLADQWRWAVHNGSGGALYVNLASIEVGSPAAMAGPAGACALTDLPCQAYNGAANNVLGAINAAQRAGAGAAPMWWLDVEVGNRWSPAKDLNALVVKAAAETLVKAGKRAGIYSTPGMWRRITGDAQLGLPVWVAGAPTDAAATTWCNADHSFNGGQVWLVQSLPLQFDHNWACAAVAGSPGSAFTFRRK